MVLPWLSTMVNHRFVKWHHGLTMLFSAKCCEIRKPTHTLKTICHPKNLKGGTILPPSPMEGELLHLLIYLMLRGVEWVHGLFLFPLVLGKM